MKRLLRLYSNRKSRRELLSTSEASWATTKSVGMWKFQANRDGLRHVPRNAVECVLFRSLLHHIGGVIVGLGIAYLGTSVEALLGVPAFAAPLVKAAAWLL